ncbi:hypothetical protein [Streptococcus intermedius]|uniref:hypothetical protein n=1 Tax=Streptococcus intermedius TaxID=1338 RepID=UPI002001AF1C|nr:hypothetical protein [Streptococcus intermedius]
MAETKEQFIKQVKSVSSELGEVLQARKFEEAFDISQRLNNLLKSEDLKDLTGRELAETGIEEIQNELNTYWWANREMRKFQGILKKRGGKFLVLAN